MRRWGLIVLVIGFACLWKYWPKAAAPSIPGCFPDTADGQIDPNPPLAYWNDQLIKTPKLLTDTLSNNQKRVLGATTEEKWIEVDLSSQTLTAHEGSHIFLSTLISSGLYNKTPVGTYHIWYKIRSTLMHGGSKEAHDYYYLPNVPYTMFFYNDFGIHGTYWHQNFGHPMSHGCVNTPTPVAEKLFYWADPQIPDGQTSVKASPDNPGTKVVVHE